MVTCLGCSSDVATAPAPPRPPAAVHDLLVAVSDTTSLLLTWTATGARDTIGTAARYDLRLATADSTRWEGMNPVATPRAPKAAGQPESVRVAGLSSQTRYRFQLVVIGPDSLRSPPSNRAEGTTGTPDRIPPGRASMMFHRASETSITVGWVAVGDDGDAGTASRYELRVCPVGATEWRRVDGLPAPRPAGQSEEFTVTGLDAESAYQLELKIFDEAGNHSAADPNFYLWTGGAEDGHWAEGFGPPPSGQGIDGPVRALASYGDLLVAGGDFTRAGVTEAAGLAAWDGRTWRTLGPIGATGNRASVTRLLATGDELFAAGTFTSIGGVEARNIARWDGTAWHPMGEGSTRGVGDLAVLNGVLVANGGFRVDSEVVSVARWDGDAWRRVASEAPSSLLAGVTGNLYCDGGDPGTLDSTAYVSRLDGAGWTPILVGPRVAPLPYASIGVTDLLSWHGQLCVCGNIVTGVYGFARAIIWDGQSWTGISPPIRTGGDMEWPTLYVLGEFQGDLVVGGDYLARQVGNSCCVLRWDGSAWSGFGSGLGFPLWDEGVPLGVVRAICEHQGSLFVGGEFDFAGLKPSQNLARWDP